MNYWQIGSGSYGRDYSEDFLRFGMAFVGGSDQVKKMKKVVQLGDRIILKRGMSQIVAAGIVVEQEGRFKGDAADETGKDWLRDYDGWDLQSYCYVEWHKPSTPINARGLTRATITSVEIPQLRAKADAIISGSPIEASIPEPNVTKELKDEEMLQHLIKLGLRPSIADDLTTTLIRIRLLARYYYDCCTWEDIGEHETRTFLIIPFLLALGWSEQHLKIELAVPGGRIDIACFSEPYRRVDGKNANNDKCTLVVESKGFSQGLDYAAEQGKSYAKAFPSCNTIVTSNGYCYKAYCRNREDSSFDLVPSAYLNLLRPRERYPRDPEKVDGGRKILEYLLRNAG